MDSVIKLLSESDLKKLIDLATQLKEISNKEEDLVCYAKELIEQGNELDKNKSELIDRSKHIIDEEDGKLKVKIDNTIESEEFIDIVTKSGDFKKEEEDINKKANDVNKELDELNKTRTRLTNEINSIFEYALKKGASKETGKKINGLGLVYILDKKLPTDIEKMSSDVCEIINCGRSLIKEIADTYSKNKVSSNAKITEDEFSILKKYVSEYDTNKDETFDNQLEILNKKIEDKIESETEKVEEPIIEKEPEEVVQKPQLEVVKEEAIEIPTPVEEPIVEKEPEEKIEEQPVKVESKPIIDISEPLTNEIVTPEVKSQPEPIVVKDPVTLEVISEIKPETDNIVPLSEVIIQK